QQIRLTRLTVGEDDEVRVGVEIEVDGRQFVLVHTDRHQAGVAFAVLVEQFFVRHAIRPQPNWRRLASTPCTAYPVERVSDPVTGLFRLTRAIHSGQTDQHVQALRRDTAPRPAGGNVDGDLPADVGLARITQPEFEAGPQHVLERGTNVGPPVRSHHLVHAVGESLHREFGDLRFEFLEVVADRTPTVHEQEGVPEGDVLGTDLTLALAITELAHRVDTE